MNRALGAVSAGFVVALSIGVFSAVPANANRLRQASLPPATFSCTGAEQTYSVPVGVGALKIKAIGARGGRSYSFSGAPAGSGGHGAIVGAWVRLPPATSTVYVEVGCTPSGYSRYTGGFNGGGSGQASSLGGAGGGASDVRLDPMSTPLTTSDTRLVVGGGGGGGGTCSDTGGAAGDASVTGAGNGGEGTRSCPGGIVGGNAGFGGTAGGGGGSAPTDGDGCNGGMGSLGQGSSLNTGCDPGYLGGAGGGGYYGGGAGGDGGTPGWAGGGGGAGSSFWVAGATHTSMATKTTSHAPEVVITPACLVPKLAGETVAAAKTALTDAHCALGTVTKKVSTRKAGIVLSQNPKPDTILTLGAKVAVIVSKT